MELKGKTDKSAILVRDFNTPLSITNRTSRQKISKEIEDLNYTINQLHLTDIYRTLHPTTAAYTYFSSAHRIFAKRDHILWDIKQVSINAKGFK